MNATATGIGITRLGQIQIRTYDVERAATFYENVLGVRLMLDRPDKQEFDHASSILYFAVPDIKAAHERMKESGVRFEDEPHLLVKMPTHDLWMTFFRDSEDNLLALMSEVAK